MLFGYATQPEPLEEQRNDLALLPQLDPWWPTFRRNIKDFLLLRDWPRPFDGRRYEGWRTVYVNTAPSWRHIRESWHGHLFVMLAGFALLSSPLFRRAPKIESPFQRATIEYLPLSEYLPPMNTRVPGSTTAKKADPVYAPQEIISVRPNADNRSQTIITPPDIKLDHDVPLPNITMWAAAEPVPPPVDVATARPRLVFPVPRPEVVEPTVDVSQLQARNRNPNLRTSAVEPAANLSELRTRRQQLQIQASAVEPAVDPSSLRRAPGQMNIGYKPEVVQPAPALPVAAQRATGWASVQAQAVPPQPDVAGVSGRRQGPVGRSGGMEAQVVPPPPSIAGVPGTGTRVGQIIALSVRPADIRGPISIPAGRRDGEFAAGPNGRPDATGTPASSGPEAGTPGKPGSGPEGVYVGAPPAGAPTSPIAGAARQKPSPVEMASVFSAAMRPGLADIARRAASNPAPVRPSPSADEVIARKVFAGKRYYSLTMNMPNLTSVTGSWIIRFAELQDSNDGITIAAPVAMNKVDPAYPQELVRDRVEGTVALYAVIHSDGSVGEIRVLRSVDRLLDASAARALAGWKFHPGTKNGSAVDLEAVIEIPFHLRTLTP